MRSYQRMVRIRRIYCITNEEVLRRAGETSELLALLAERRNTMIGHISQVIRDVGCNSHREMKVKALNREEWAADIANRTVDYQRRKTL